MPIVFLVVASLIAGSPATDREKSVENIIKSHVEAWKAQDAKALAQLFAEDGERIDTNGVKTEGRKQIEEAYGKTLQTGQLRDSSHTITSKKVRFITDDVAIVDVNWLAKGIRDNQGKTVADRSGSTLLILKHRTDTWEIVSLRALKHAD
jgi:uncharacterized protein (TIGR02246 family)